MFDWLGNPVWGGIGVLGPLLGWACLRGYGVWKKNRRAAKNATGSTTVPPPSEAYACVNRFVSIFKAHDIERIQIPRFLGEDSGLAISHMGDDSKLLNNLSEKILNDTCSRFGISRDWLDGKQCTIYPQRWYDKNLKKFIDFLEQIKQEHDWVQGYVVKCNADKLKQDGPNLPIAFIFRGTLSDWGEQGDSVWRYYPLNDIFYWGYERTRFQIKAMVLAAWQFDIIINGCVTSEENVKALLEGEVFPSRVLYDSRSAAWHPDAYIFSNGESQLVEDGADALAMRQEMERLGWMTYLIDKTGPIKFPNKL